MLKTKTYRFLKVWIVLFQLLIATVCCAQSRNWHFGIQLYPNIIDGIPISGVIGANYYQGAKTISFSYSGGAKINYSFNEKFELSTGVLFQKIGDKSQIYEADTIKGFANARYYKTQFIHLEIPINLEYNFSDKFYIVFGLSFTQKIKDNIEEFTDYGNSEFVLSKKEIFDGSLIAKKNLLLNFGIGYKKTIGDNIFFVSTYFQYHLLADLKDFEGLSLHGMVGRRYLSFGINVGFLF